MFLSRYRADVVAASKVEIECQQHECGWAAHFPGHDHFGLTRTRDYLFPLLSSLGLRSGNKLSLNPRTGAASIC